MGGRRARSDHEHEDGQGAEALPLVYDFLNRQRELLADRTVYRPEEVTEWKRARRRSEFRSEKGR